MGVLGTPWTDTEPPAHWDIPPPDCYEALWEALIQLHTVYDQFAVTELDDFRSLFLDLLSRVRGTEICKLFEDEVVFSNEEYLFVVSQRFKELTEYNGEIDLPRE